MANNTYLQNEADYQAMLKCIQGKIDEALDLGDTKEKYAWEQKQKELNSWIEGLGFEADPIDDTDWLAINLEKPEPIAVQDESSDDLGTIVEFDFDKEVGKKIAEYRSALGQKDDRSILAIESYVKDVLPRVQDNQELVSQLNELAEDTIKKRVEVTRGIIDQAASLSKDEARQLLLRAKNEWNPDDAALNTEIDKKLAEIPAEIGTDTIAIKLGDIDQHNDYDRFLSSLYFLENLCYTYSFTNEQFQKIKNARDWYQNKQNKDGIRSSMSLIGDLQAVYQEYQNLLRNPESQYLYNGKFIDKDKYTEIFLGQWRARSTVSVQKESLKADKIAKTSPINARAYMERLLSDEVEVTFDDGVKDKIKRYPFTNDDVMKIHAKIDSLESECAKESEANNLVSEANSAGLDPIIKLEKYLDAKARFALPGIDQKIYDQIKPTITARKMALDANVIGAKNKLGSVLQKDEDTFVTSINELTAEANDLITACSRWPHVGETLKYSREGKEETYTIEFPAEVKQIQAEVQQLLVEINEYKNAYDFLIKQRTKIVAGLGNTETRNAALDLFSGLSKTAKVTDFHIYKVLSDQVIPQSDLRNNLNLIRQNIQEQRWLMALNNCRKTMSASTYQESSMDLKSQMAQLQSQAEAGYHRAEFYNCWAKQNYPGTMFEYNWLIKNGVNEEQIKAIGEKLDQITNAGAALDTFFQQTLNESGINSQVLTRIGSARLSFLEQYYRNPDVKSAENMLIKRIIDEETQEIRLPDYRAELSKQWSPLAFASKCLVLKKIHHVGYKEEVDHHENWPEYSPSYSGYDAVFLYDHLKDLLKAEILEFIRALKISEIKKTEIPAILERFKAFHDFSFTTEEVDRQAILDKEYQVTKLAEASLDLGDRYTLWKSLHQNFPEDPRINNRWKATKKDHILAEIDRSLVTRKYKRAKELIDAGMDDPDIGSCLELNRYMIILTTDESGAETFSPAIASNALEKVRMWKAPEDDIKALNTRVEIARLCQANKDDTFSNLILISRLHDKLEIDLHTVEEKFRTGYSSYIGNNIEEFRKKISGNSDDQREAIGLLLKINQLDQIYNSMFASGQSGAGGRNQQNNIEGFVGEIAPLLFVDGIYLLRDGNAVLRNAKQPVPTSSIHNSIKETDILATQLDSFINFLNKMSKPETNGANEEAIDPKSKLSVLVEKVISLHVPEISRELKLADLREQVEQNDNNPILGDFSILATRLKNETTTIKGMLANYLECCGEAYWRAGSGGRLLNDSKADWEALGRLVIGLSDGNRRFKEISKVIQTFADWDVTLVKAANDYSDLQNSFENEDFAEARIAILEFKKDIDSLVEFDEDSEKLTRIKSYLLNSIHVKDNFFIDQINSFESIRDAIVTKEKNLSAWVDEKLNIESDCRVITDRNTEFLNQFEIFSKLLVGSERSTLQVYLSSVDGLKDIHGEASVSSSGGFVIPGAIQAPRDQVQQGPQNNLLNNFERLIGRNNAERNAIPLQKLLRYNDKNDVMLNELPVDLEEKLPSYYDLQTDFQFHNNYLRVKYQMVFFSSVLKFIQKCNDYHLKFFAEVPPASGKADKLADSAKTTQSQIDAANKVYQTCLDKSRELIRNNPLNDIKWYENEYSARRHNNIVNEIHKKDIYQSRSDIEQYRKNLIRYFGGVNQ